MSEKKAKLRYAGTAPSPEQIEKIKAVLCDKFKISNLEIETELDPSIGGGFIVSYANFESDWSDFGRARQLRAELHKYKTRCQCGYRQDNFHAKGEGGQF